MNIISRSTETMPAETREHVLERYLKKAHEDLQLTKNAARAREEALERICDEGRAREEVLRKRYAETRAREEALLIETRAREEALLAEIERLKAQRGVSEK